MYRSLHLSSNPNGESTVEELASFRHDLHLGRDLRIIATVKNCFQVDKNCRQEAQRARQHPEIHGREKVRPFYYGLVVAYSLAHDRLAWDLGDAEWSFSSLEPYCIDIFDKLISLCGGNCVEIVDMDSGVKRSFQHPWLRQAHSVQFSADGRRLLVSSSGFDAVFEFDVSTGKTCWEWFAWDHGLDQSRLGEYFVRSRQRGEELAAQGHKVVLVDDPSQHELGIPTRFCPVHINGAFYDRDENLLVTLFQQGGAIRVDKATGEASTIASGLINPHKLHSRSEGGYYVADTRRGELLLLDDGFQVVRRISLREAPGAVRSALLTEFLQSVSELDDALFACVDIHRSTLWLIDVNARRYRGVTFPREWSVHDIALNHCSPAMKDLVSKTFGRVDATVDVQGGKRICHFSPEGSENTTYILDSDGRTTGGKIEI
ncbi:hypothetical protein OOT46_19895 [Aquabacterium sp. A7-Y]|uniref:hypothetical protein n=1 Tax=Aquabacterium sp. A7-Y TaxID=1349605 RepID=UPI00223D72D6|nr:hypothetical protein [Aquabacterium sp. A7-Y]MCW7540101.1 hypothetical protein [Aquabacterium sp. A7-Y]